MSTSSNPPPDGPARTVFDIGTPIHVSPAAEPLPGRGRVIGWGLFGAVTLTFLAIAMANLSGLGSDGPPKPDPVAERPPLSWNSSATQPIASTEAIDASKTDSDPAPKKKAPTKAAVPNPKPTARATPKPKKPTAAPTVRPTPTATSPGRQRTVQLGARCRSEGRRAFTEHGLAVVCTRTHRGQLRWLLDTDLPPRGGGWGQDGWGQDPWGHDGWGQSTGNDRDRSSRSDGRSRFHW